MAEDVEQMISRLRALLAATAEDRARVAEVQAAWDLWYDECHDIHARYDFGQEAERHRTIHGDDLPRPVERVRDCYEDKQDHITTLHRLGDPRAADVLVAALADRACLPKAAEALRDIRSDKAVPAMLDGIATTWISNDVSIKAVAATLQTYGVTPTQVRKRFDAETTPRGRVNLRELLRRMAGTADVPPEEEIRDDLVYLALNHKDDGGGGGQTHAQFALQRMDGTAATADDQFGNPVPAAHLIRRAIVLAAQGKPAGHAAEMRRSVLHYSRTPPAAEAVESVLTEESSEEVLRFALYMCLTARTTGFADPIRVARVLDTLLGRRSLSEDAMLVLRRTDLLFDLMLAGNEEAERIFRSFATPEEEERFARRASATRPRWRFLRWPGRKQAR